MADTGETLRAQADAWALIQLQQWRNELLSMQVEVIEKAPWLEDNEPA